LSSIDIWKYCHVLFPSIPRPNLLAIIFPFELSIYVLDVFLVLGCYFL
jgi:hypothetical protein